MMNIQSISAHSDKIQHLDNFDPKTMTWLVADLTTKSEIQLILLKKHGVLPEDAVLRASELWSKLFQKLYPSWRLVSHDFLRSQLSEFLKSQNHSFASTPGASKTLMTFVQQLLPILSDPQGEENLQAWLKENPSAVIRWGHWLELSRAAWNELNTMKIITGTWCSGILAGHEQLETSWPRQIYSDLGCQMHAVEASLLKSLGEKNSVTIFRPENDWSQRYAKTLNAYGVLQSKKDPVDTELAPLPVPKASSEKILEIERYSTMVTEVKSVVSKVRSDLDSGISAEKIALLSPDIELYWPVLHHYLEQEGVPFQKKLVARLQTYSDVEIWLARLRLAIGKVTSHDLERVSFGEEARLKNLGFEKFKRLFSIVYDDADLGRWKEVKNLFESQKTESEKMLAHEFLTWISSFWPDNENTDRLARVIKKIYTESPLNLQREVMSWMDLLENLTAKEEVSILDGDANGIHCLNIQEASWVEVDSRYFLGLSADALRSQETSGLLFSDVQKIQNDLGYILLWPDKAHLEFETLWLLQKSVAKTVINFSATDFSGSILAPSLIWLLTAFKNDRDVEELSLPQLTRWDNIQRGAPEDVAQFRLWSKEHAQSLETAIRQDLGEVDPEKFGGDLEWSLSASQLENFLACPFQFAAGKIFRLSDEPDLDLDIDHLSKGKMLHKLFELLTETPFRADWTESEIEEVVDRLPRETKSPLADARLWPSARIYYRELAKRFLDKESQLRDEFSEMKTVGRELELTGKWSQKQGKLVGTDGEGIPFRGVIDRVDTNDEGQFILVDYKSQDTTQTSHQRWLANNCLQLPLYSMAFEEGLSEIPPGEVIGAFYYSAKTMNREKGFRMEGHVGTLFADNKRSLSHISPEKKKALYDGVVNKISEVVDRMEKGVFAPDPEDQSTCNSCSWKKICRAPHLNS